ncbi:alpha/beta hydrolase [Sporosarcina beigongshangi]|uniref:alpha/beta hydrolase n=1 Tax=Sporosarcina beigongshangi TaxID=2782538 RepID=UPI0019397033|nr:hypothetical protein [Sporosarcina beigongshangi]
MRIKKAQPIFIEGNEIAVLLLHSFTSHTRDMKALAEPIHQSFGFTCFVPLFSGHGQEAEALIAYTIDRPPLELKRRTIDYAVRYKKMEN